MSLRRLTPRSTVSVKSAEQFRGMIGWVRRDSLQATPHPTRSHSKKQIRQIARSIERRGFIKPLGVRNNTVYVGNACLEAAAELGMAEVPILRLDHLSEVEIRAYAIDDNKLSDNSAFDTDLLAVEIKALLGETNEGIDLFAGFTPPEIDNIFSDHDTGSDPADQVPESAAKVISRTGDFWRLGKHRLGCGDAKSADDMSTLMAGERAAIVFTDPPWNLPTRFFQERGKIKHANFAEGYVEQSNEEFCSTFLTPVFDHLAKHSIDGSLHYICGDHRHIREFLAAGYAVFDEFNNLIVWSKTVPGLGSPYKSQHELIFLFKKGKGATSGRH